MSDLIKRLRELAGDADDRGFLGFVTLMCDAADALEIANARIAALEAQIGADKKDAERYRFLRDDDDWRQNDRYWDAISAGGEKLDKTIDAALAEQQRGE